MPQIHVVSLFSYEVGNLSGLHYYRAWFCGASWFIESIFMYAFSNHMVVFVL